MRTRQWTRRGLRLSALLALFVVASPSAGGAVRDRTRDARSYRAAPYGVLHPILDDLLTYHPGWITRVATSHDPGGGNADSWCDDELREGPYQVLLHAKGEGRITRLWMTADSDKTMPFDYHELWIVIDGVTQYRGPPQDFFWGKDKWKAPVVLDGVASSGAYTSWAPFPFKHEAKILFRNRAHFYQVGYRQGPGSSAGPSADEISRFLTEPWWLEASRPYAELTVDADTPQVLATGDALVTHLSLQIDPKDLPSLRLRIGNQRPFPLAAFFGFLQSRQDPKYGWPHAATAFARADVTTGTLVSRLPIPLKAGERLVLEQEKSKSPARVMVAADLVRNASGGARLLTDWRMQPGARAPTTFPVFEASGPLSFVSQVYEGTGGANGMANFLEGDEMVRIDAMRAPIWLGTGTEDYFNGGWYFKGPHTNPLSGLTRQVEHGHWTDPKRQFELSMFRHHALDPIVARNGMRFGWEAGDNGADKVVVYRSLALAYAFDDAPHEVQRTRLSLDPSPSNPTEQRLGEPTHWVTSAIDAEWAELPFAFPVREARGSFVIACPPGPPPAFATITRDYDAGIAGQSASVTLDGATVARFFEPTRNTKRRFAQDTVYVHLAPDDCRNGALHFALAAVSASPWTESAYEVALYR